MPIQGQRSGRPSHSSTDARLACNSLPTVLATCPPPSSIQQESIGGWLPPAEGTATCQDTTLIASFYPGEPQENTASWCVQPLSLSQTDGCRGLPADPVGSPAAGSWALRCARYRCHHGCDAAATYALVVAALSALGKARCCDAAVPPMAMPAQKLTRSFLATCRQADSTATIRTRKFLTNRLLQRKQFVRCLHLGSFCTSLCTLTTPL